MKDLNFLKFLFLFIIIFTILISRNYARINFQNYNLDNKIKNNNLSLKDIPRATLPYIDGYESNSILNSEINNIKVNNNKLSLVNSSLNTGFILKYKNLKIVEPQISAHIALVADLESKDILWGKNLDKRWPIASLTKLITAAYVLKNFDQKTKIAISTEKNSNDQATNTLSILNGEAYLVSDLVKLMLLSSSNEAAELLANLENRDNFIWGMNNLVKEWGANFTYFVDPTGLSMSNQSTAYDLLNIVYKIKEEYPDILKWSSLPSIKIKELNSQKLKKISNIHPFAGVLNFLGGKTGYIPEARQNLISVFNLEGKKIVILILGSNDRAQDTKLILEWFKSNFKLVE